jgi:opacity protein-like surface antigen
MRKSYMKEAKMRFPFILAGLLVVAAGMAVAQDAFPKLETAPAFTYVHNSPVLGGTQGFNCAGGGGTIAYNMTSMLGMAMDLSTCHIFGLDNTYGVGSKVNGNEFTYVFGPRLTFRQHKFQPFFEINFGGERVSLKCNQGNAGNACNSLVAVQPLPPPSGTVIIVPRNPNATSFSKNAFAMTVGGGADIKINRKFALRLVQAEYLYTRFGNDCPLAYCSNNNNQNSFRLKSGIVMSWGGAQ